MDEYIEKDKAVGIAHGYCHTKDGRCCGPDDVVDLYEELKSIPAADVVEVRKAKWVWLSSTYDRMPCEKRYECSNCHHETITHNSDPWENFCPNCGAKMEV